MLLILRTGLGFRSVRRRRPDWLLIGYRFSDGFRSPSGPAVPVIAAGSLAGNMSFSVSSYLRSDIVRLALCERFKRRAALSVPPGGGTTHNEMPARWRVFVSGPQSYSPSALQHRELAAMPLAASAYQVGGTPLAATAMPLAVTA